VQFLQREDVTAAGLAASDPIELAELLLRVDADVRVRADAQFDAAVEEAFDGDEAVGEIRLRRRACADAGAGSREEVELLAVRMRRVYDGRARGQASACIEQFDRPEAVLGETLLDFARLLVGVDVEREVVLRRVAAELLEPVARARAHGMGGDPDSDARGAQRLELREVRRDRLLPEAVDPATRVRDVEENDLDPRIAGSLDRGVRLRVPEVVELADRGVPRRAELAIDVRVRRAHALRRLPRRELEHRLAPRPEVRARGPLAERALEGVAVGIHIHGRILPHMEARVDAHPLAQLPNALTIARLILIPVFVVLMIRAGHAPSWSGGIVFFVAGVTDQLDGFLARLWRVESRFGKLADPLADRLMIDAAVVLLFAYDRLPWVGLAVIVARDAVLLAGSGVLVPRGVEVDVNLLGKAATWILYAAIFWRIVLAPTTTWPVDLFWAGLALAVLAGVFYVREAWGGLKR
jgi:CDP-diacylglycerol--glycerol-3-phosphate 3-phosphatidyltransferase